jgi:hypothetical protein
MWLDALPRQMRGTLQLVWCFGSSSASRPAEFMLQFSRPHATSEGGNFVDGFDEAENPPTRRKGFIKQPRFQSLQWFLDGLSSSRRDTFLFERLKRLAFHDLCPFYSVQHDQNVAHYFQRCLPTERKFQVSPRTEVQLEMTPRTALNRAACVVKVLFFFSPGSNI